MPTDRTEALVQEGLELEAVIERTAVEPVWAYADWLLEKFGPPQHGGDRQGRSGGLALSDYAEHSQYGRSWLKALRKVAHDFPPNVRAAGVAPRVHMKALEVHGNVEEAVAAMSGGSPRLRDFAPMESASATRRQVLSLPPEQRASILREALEDETTMREVARTAPGTAHRMSHAAIEQSGAFTPNPLPGGVEEPNVGFRTRMSGPMLRLRDARTAVVDTWTEHLGIARDIELDAVRDWIAEDVAALSALITDMEVPS